MEEERTRKENIVAGVVGAFLGSLIGVVCTVVIGQLGYVAAISGLIMAVCALKGYELLGGTLSKKGVAVSAVLILAMTWFAHQASWAIALAGAMEGEQIRIGTISDQLAYQCEFTTDKEALNQVIEGITYSNQDTYLSDILYDVIASLEQENTGVLTRIVIFADGADDKAIGYTNEEVRRIIEKGAYPVYAIGFPKGNNFAQLETMFSFARASFSEYYLADGTVTHEEIINGLLQDQKDLCVRIRPDESLDRKSVV